VAHFNLED
jgi:hypothetical protein